MNNDYVNMRLLKILGFLLSFPAMLSAQHNDSLSISIGTQLSGATRDFQPLWISSNSFGVISDMQADASTSFRMSSFHKLNLFKDTTKFIGLSYSADIVSNQHLKKLFLGEGYLKVSFKSLQFQGGRFRERTGEMDGELSSGSFGISGNALPIPKLKLSVPNYIDLPFTRGFVQIKGAMSHGWMGNDRFMQNAFFHEKSLYARVVLKKVKVFGGFQHFAEWGGNRGSFRLDRSFGGFLDVLFVREANDGSLDMDFYPDKRPNRAGDQRGLFEYGLEFEKKRYFIKVYNQTPFESGKGIDIRNIDRLLGLTVSSKEENSFLQRIVVEFFHTKQMETFGSSERQSYYNNGVYANGWEYSDRIIGTPLFTNRVRGSKFLDVEPFDWDNTREQPGNKNIINNRIVGGHVGLNYRISERLNGKTLLTYTVNYGTHSKAIISSPQNQFYSLQQLEYDISRGLLLNFSIGLDSGNFYNNIGSLVGVRYYLKKN